MPQFMLIAVDSPGTFDRLSPEEQQRIVERYIAWTDRLRGSGRLQSGAKLTDEGGRVVEKEEGRVVVRDGPYTETKEVIGGFWIIEADSYDDLIGMLDDHPHLEFGKLEVRQVDAGPEAS